MEIHERTDEQNAGVAAAVDGKSIIFEALAGTAKTTTLGECAQDIARAKPATRFLYCAFNRSTKESAQTRFAPFGLNLDCRTQHQLGYAGVGYRFKERLGSGGDGLFDLVPALADTGILARFVSGNAYEFGTKVIDVLARYCGSREKVIGIEHLPLEPTPYDADTLIEAARVTWAAITDFSSMLPVWPDVYLKMYALSEPRLNYDVIMFDEAQDASASMFAITERQRSAQRIYAGDSFQAIYASFRYSVDVLTMLDLPRYPLTNSFRFGSTIAAYVNRLLEARGTDRRIVGVREDPGAVVINDDRNADMVLARSNVGVFEAAIAALDRRVRGISLAGGMKAQTTALMGAYALRNGRAAESGLFRRFRTWQEVTQAAASEQGSKFMPFVKLVDEYGARIPDIVKRLEEAQKAPSRGGMAFGTIHGAKGDEWSMVRMHGDLQPFSRGGTLDVEMANLWYVAFTRAKTVLDLGSAANVITEALGPPASTPASAEGPLFAAVRAAAAAGTAGTSPAPPPIVAPSAADDMLNLLRPPHHASEPIAASSDTLARAAGDAEPATHVPPLVRAQDALLDGLIPQPASEASTTRPVVVARRFGVRRPLRAVGEREERSSLPTPIVVPSKDRFRVARLGARLTSAGWVVPAGQNLAPLGAWRVEPSADLGTAPGKGKLAPVGEPATIVGASLAERMGSAYAGMRLTLAVRPAACEICGSIERREPHAIFEYADGVAKLTTVVALCAPCHRAHHIESASEAIVLKALAVVNKEPLSLSAVRLSLAKRALAHRNGTWWVIEDQRRLDVAVSEVEAEPSIRRVAGPLPQWTLDLSKAIAMKLSDSISDAMAYARAMIATSQPSDAP
jgi:hypothetical protein